FDHPAPDIRVAPALPGGFGGTPLPFRNVRPPDVTLVIGGSQELAGTPAEVELPPLVRFALGLVVRLLAVRRRAPRADVLVEIDPVVFIVLGLEVEPVAFDPEA